MCCVDRQRTLLSTWSSLLLLATYKMNTRRKYVYFLREIFINTSNKIGKFIFLKKYPCSLESMRDCIQKKDGWKVSRNFCFVFFLFLACIHVLIWYSEWQDGWMFSFFFFPKTSFSFFDSLFFSLSRIKYKPVSWRVCFSPCVCVCTSNSTSRFFLFLDWLNRHMCLWIRPIAQIYLFF